MRRLLAILAVTLIASACSGEKAESRILVSAASSLGEVFAALEAEYEAAHPGADIVLNIAGSSLLREQVLAGAPVDVFAPASQDIMVDIQRADLSDGESQVFARNLLEIAVPLGNPAGVVGLGDFARDDLFLGLCASQVPCGELAREALASAGVVPQPDTDEPNVRSLLTKIETGELDAGIVYVSDVRASGDVEGITIPDDVNVVAEYPIAVIDDAPNQTGALQFVGFVLSDQGQRILADHGFETP